MTYSIEGSTGAWEVVIGLEVHAQIISQSKLFSGAATGFGRDPHRQRFAARRAGEKGR